MKKISNILFPTDFSEPANNAFRYALWFADKYGASIELVHVIYPEAEPMDFPVLVGQSTKVRAEAAREVMKIFVDSTLAQIQAGHQLQNIPNVISDIQTGAPASVIADIAKRDDVDMVIMGTHGEHNALEKIFGSVTTATMQRVECPVLVVPENVTFEHISTLAYATDLEVADPYHIWETCRLLEPFSPILHVVHIQQKPSESKSMEMKELENFFAGKAPALQVKYHYFGARDVVEELSDFAEAWEIDLMVMQRPHRGFFERIFHRSVSREMALLSNTPLLIMQ